MEGKKALQQTLANMLNTVTSNEECKKAIDSPEKIDSLLDYLDEFLLTDENMRASAAKQITLPIMNCFKARYGINGDGNLKTFEQVAADLGVTRERAVQADAKVLGQLIHFITKEREHIDTK